MKEFLAWVVVGIGVIGLCLTLSKIVWNDGNCRKCGNGNYIFKEAVGHKSSTSYIYECDNCHHHIQLGEIGNFVIVEWNKN